MTYSCDNMTLQWTNALGLCSYHSFYSKALHPGTFALSLHLTPFFHPIDDLYYHESIRTTESKSHLSLQANFWLLTKTSIRHLFCVAETDFFLFKTDKDGCHSDRRQFDWFGVNKNNLTDRLRHKYSHSQKQTFKKAPLF